MGSVQPPSRSVGHDMGHGGDLITTRPRASSERDLMRNSMSMQRPDENRSPVNFPRACEGMLKTTTETGDIGMFSIKPSRVPQSLGTPRKQSTNFNHELGHQKPRQTFQPYGVPVVDDRRRLPSYARDAASEVISMYESASQKSGSRVFDEPDYRSYSMTQTSYSSYTLSNHRSYNSLRSQADAHPQVQRPRSPFAYPARLKRPGFRPSSPALTDGGIVDYSRRAEIERLPQGSGHATSSPASLYAQRRRPHQSLRPDTNRSTPSLLSQTSPPRRSSSPLVSRSNGVSSHDWARRPGPASVNTSPARSTFSLASTVNIYASAQPPSTTTTPGKAPPPSPLYYDYTEDFEVEVYNEPAVIDPPPLFRIDKTIPEDRPMSSDRPPSKVNGPNNGYRTFQALSAEPQVSLNFDEHRAVGPEDLETTAERTHLQSAPDAVDTASQGEHGRVSQDQKSDRLSGLGYQAQQLRSHVDEAFGNFPSSALEITSPKESESVANLEFSNTFKLGGGVEKEAELPSARSSYSIITSIPHFPSPPSVLEVAEFKDLKDVASGELAAGSLGSMGSWDTMNDPFPSQPYLGRQYHGIASSGSNPGSRDDKASIRSKPHETTVSNPARDNLGTDFENKAGRNRGQEEPSSELRSMRRTPMVSPTVPEGFNLRRTDSEQGHTPPMSLHNRRRAADGQNAPQLQPLKRSQYYGSRRLDHSSISDLAANVPNFSHHNPKKDLPRPESPMLAPKPISPARQLKLKNSVPQLMKALPPLPPEPSSRPGSPEDQVDAEEGELPCEFSPLARDFSSNSSQAKPPVPAKVLSPVRNLPIDKDKKDQFKVNTAVHTTTSTEENGPALEASESSLPPPRMKLKVRSSASQRPTSPPDSRPWNLAENYPWSSQSSLVRLPVLPPSVPDNQVSVSKQPRFKLKVTRASNSTQGTVRVNRSSGDSKPLMHLRNPKDFFTPPTGIDNIFRQVSRHLHSRKPSMASSQASQNDLNSPSPSIPNPKCTINSPLADSHITQLPSAPINPLITSEARSVFSDDSSNNQGHHSLRLRGRLSNLRARIAAPYAMRAGSQSHDDITWRDRHGIEATVPPAARSIPDLHGNRKSAESIRPMRRWVEKARRQKLKAKVHVQGWLKEAKSAVKRVRTRSTTGDGGDLVAIRA